MRLQYRLNTLDNPVVPRSGQSLLMYTNGYNTNPAAPGPFPLSEVQSQNFFRLDKPSSVFFNASGGSTYGFKAWNTRILWPAGRSVSLPGIRTSCGQTNISWDRWGISGELLHGLLPCWAVTSSSSELRGGEDI